MNLSYKSFSTHAHSVGPPEPFQLLCNRGFHRERNILKIDTYCAATQAIVTDRLVFSKSIYSVMQSDKNSLKRTLFGML